MDLINPKRGKLILINTYIVMLLIVISSMPLYAQAGAGVERRVTLKYAKISAAALLNDLARQSGFDISFNSSEFEKLEVNHI